MRLPQPVPELPVNDVQVAIWLNMGSSAEVDQLHAEWKGRGALIVGGTRNHEDTACAECRPMARLAR